jgi:ankyrin repeat protein
MKRRAAVESLLLAAGAHEDVFTSAFLGDLTPLAQMLTGDPGLAQAADPAVDVLDITPAEHAVAGRQASALRLLLDHVPGPRPYVRALRGAAAQGSLAMAELLLAHGADATGIGVGRWVLHPELAPLLASRGAAIDSSGSWIAASCTGNQGRQDDPEYVRALLRHGARATAGPARGRSTRRRCTTPPRQASWGPSGFSSSTVPTRAPATATAAPRLTGWTRLPRRCRGPRSGT